MVFYNKGLMEREGQNDEVREHFAVALDVAVREAEELVTSSDSEVRIVQEGHNEYLLDDDFNWSNVLHTYHTWGEGKVKKGKGRRNCCYSMNWTLHVRDNYEWSDETHTPLWELHHYGLARHFRSGGSRTIRVAWIKGYPFSVEDGMWINSWKQRFPQCQ